MKQNASTTILPDGVAFPTPEKNQITAFWRLATVVTKQFVYLCFKWILYVVIACGF
jgi:hypothetical protein